MVFDLEQAIEILSRTPRALSVLLVDLSDEWIFASEGGQTWNAFDVVGHLIHGEKTDWIVRMKIILDHGASVPFEPFDRFSQQSDSVGKSMDDLLEEFADLRSKSVETLREMMIASNLLDRTGLHPELGIVTLRQLLSAWVVHDLGHIAQIARVMSKRYMEDVGPWYEYMNILHDRS
jgi:hypothetical protein